MPSLTVTAKGQITLNKAVLKHLGVRPGDKINVDLRPEHEIAMRPAQSGRSIESLLGMLKVPDDPVLTLEEIKQAIEDGWAGKR